MARAWYRSGEPPLRVYCRSEDCYRVVTVVANAVPVSCPGCSRQFKDGGDWWTIERPAGKPVKGRLTEKDLDFLRCQRIAPWEGGIDTE